MAGFKGFGFTSAAEIQEQAQQAFAQLGSGGNVDANRLSIARQAAGALAPPETVRQARQKEEVLKKAFADSRKDTTGDEVEDQIQFLKNAQAAAVEAGLPDIAIQATEQLSALRVGQEERARLNANEARKAEAFELQAEQAEREGLLAAQKVLVDETGTPIMNVDVTRQEDIDALKTELQENPNARLIDNKDLFNFNSDQLLLQQRLDASREIALAQEANKDNGLPVTTLNRFYNDASGQMTFAHSLDNMVEILGEDPDAFAAATSVEAGIAKMASQGRAFARSVGIDSSIDRRIQGKLEEANVTNGRRRAAVMDLAYAMATSREGGRLTDQDIDRAIETMGFLDQPDPRTIVTVLQDRVANARESWRSRGDIAGIRTNEKTQDTWEAVDRVYGSTEEKLNTLADALQGIEGEVEDVVEQDVPVDVLTTEGLDTSTRAILFDTVQ